MHIPHKIKVGAYTYEVRYRKKISENDKDLWGLCDRDKHIIYLQIGMADQKKKEVVLHECLHAIEESYGLTFAEKTVNQLSLALITLIGDNKLRF